jgi:hypothetical protein
LAGAGQSTEWQRPLLCYRSVHSSVIGWGRTEHGVAETPSLLQVSTLLCDWLGQDRARGGRDPFIQVSILLCDWLGQEKAPSKYLKVKLFAFLGVLFK